MLSLVLQVATYYLYCTFLYARYVHGEKRRGYGNSVDLFLAATVIESAKKPCHIYYIPWHRSHSLYTTNEQRVEATDAVEDEEELDDDDEVPEMPYPGLKKMSDLEREVSGWCDEEEVCMLNADLSGKKGKQRWRHLVCVVGLAT